MKKDKKVDIDEKKVLTELETAEKAEIAEASEKKIGKMGAKLKELIKEDLEEYKKREKTRAAEMIGIFSSSAFFTFDEVGLLSLDIR